MSESQSHFFSLTCTDCQNSIEVPLTALSEVPFVVTCRHCQKHFGFSDSTLVQNMKQFISLCKEIKASENIISSASIAVRVGKEEVLIPFKLLLTRLRSTFDLQVGDKKMTISYRTEPTKVAEALEKELFDSTL